MGTQATDKGVVKFLPLMVWREGGVPFAALRDLTQEPVMGVLARVEQVANARRASRQALLDGLHAQVGQAQTKQDRRALLKLRRDIFNDRYPASQALTTARQYLSPAQARELDSWIELHEREDLLREEARVALVEGMRHARSSLARVFAREHFARAVQLSGPHLYEAVRSYASQTSITGEWQDTPHNAEGTLVSLAYRSSLKPSPFAGFTLVGMASWEQAGKYSGTAVRAVAHTDHGLLDQMLAILAARPENSDAFDLRLNPTIRHDEGTLEYIVPVSSHSPSVESLLGQFRTMQLDKDSQRIIELLSEYPMSQSLLLGKLHAAGVDSDRAVRLLDGLISSGVCYRHLGVLDHEFHFAQAIADRLAAVGNVAAEGFRKIADYEKEYTNAHSNRRSEILAAVERETRALACADHTESKPRGRAPIFEEVGRVSPPRNWDHRVPEAHASSFGLLHHLLPLFDPFLIPRVALYQMFVTHLDGGGADVEFLEFYRRFIEVCAEADKHVLSRRGGRLIAEIRRLRFKFTSYIEKLSSAGLERPALHLEPHWVRSFTDEFPEHIPAWRSATHLVQELPEDSGPSGLVLNEVRGGDGAFLARFAHLADYCASDDVTSEELRQLVRGNPQQCDIAAVFGLNYNVHPPLAPHTIAYPGTNPGGADVLTPRDLLVRADPDRNRLLLVSRHTGTAIDVVSMNAGQPAAMPHLYQFMHLFARDAVFRGGLWDLFMATQGNQKEHVHTPRLSLGGIVLERRSWSFPAAAVHELLRACTDEIETLQTMENWRKRHGLPLEGFFCIKQAGVGFSPSSTADIYGHMFDPAARRARTRKPHYLHFHNPFLLSALGRGVASAPEGARLIIQECLPGTAVYQDGSDRASAEEWAVEVNLEP